MATASDQFGDHYRRSKAKYPHYSDISMRKKSFYSWPDGKEQIPEILAEAGFFYAGMQDCTRCFDCGGGLRNWLPGDVPIVEHARWFPECGYIRNRVGDDFVDNVHINHPRDQEVTDGDGDTASGIPVESEKPVDFTEIVDSVRKMACGEALSTLGFTSTLITASITKVLSDCGWDKSKVTSSELARAALDMDDVETDGPTSDGADNVATSQKTILGTKSTSESQLVEGLESVHLMTENRKMKDQMKCKICMENEVSIVFLPCGHLVTCSKCYSYLTHCALCRQKIAASVKTFM